MPLLGRVLAARRFPVVAPGRLPGAGRLPGRPTRPPLPGVEPEKSEEDQVVEQLDERAEGPHPLQNPNFPYRIRLLVSSSRSVGKPDCTNKLAAERRRSDNASCGIALTASSKSAWLTEALFMQMLPLAPIHILFHPVPVPAICHRSA